MPLHDQPNSKRQKTIFDFFGDLADQGNRLPMQVDAEVDEADHIGARIESADAAHPAAGNRESGGSLPSDSSTDGPEPNPALEAQEGRKAEHILILLAWSHHRFTRLQMICMLGRPNRTQLVQKSAQEVLWPITQTFINDPDRLKKNKQSRTYLRKSCAVCQTEEMKARISSDLHSIISQETSSWQMNSLNIREAAKYPETEQTVRRRNSCRAEAKGRRDLLIKPAGVSSRTGAPERRLDDTKHRIAKILVALECFHRLAREHGIDDRIFGYQTMSDHSDLSDWFIGILFEKSEDSYPLFGHFQNEWPETVQPEKMFGSVQKVMSIILMNWKRPKIVNINEVALSLLGHWYKITALKLGRSYLTHHPDTYWSMMARIIKEQPLRRAGLLRKLNEEASVFKYHNGEEDFFTINSERLMSREISMWQSSLFDLIESRRKTDLGSGMTKYIRERIEKKIREGVPRGPNSRDFEQRDKEYQRRKSNQYTLLERRITEIFESLNILHKIASEKNLDSKILGSGTGDTHEQLMTWYLDVLFSEKSDSLPIFGTVKILFPPDRPIENLFGSAQKFLSITLSRLGKFKKTHSNRIALLLLGFWYQETALKLGRNTSGDDDCIGNL
ncbi:hypothetical protein PSTT_08377, partial [Puccinia striiformis]